MAVTTNTAGPLLSEAARLADDAHRLLVASTLHLEAAGVVLLPETVAEIAELLDDADAYAGVLLRVADNDGHAEVGRRAVRTRREVAA